MKKVIFILALLHFNLFATTTGDPDRGLTYYKFIILPMIDIKGNEFTIKHTKKEWKELFLDDAKLFKKKYSSLNMDFATFLESKKFKKISKDIESFFVYYAKDSDIKPQCGQ